MSGEPVYLDHHATTPVDPRVVERMIPYFSQTFGNAAAITHEHGRAASRAVEEARETIVGILGVDRSELYFTAGATESNNIVLQSLGMQRGRHVIVSAIEHKSVLEPGRALERNGIELTILGVDGEGFVSLDDLESALRDDTSVVSVMTANGEIGTIQSFAKVAEVCRSRGVPFHMDATQAVGKIEVDLSRVACDLLSFSAHKFYGPKGIGGLVVRRGTRARAIMQGGGQEKGLRSGTLNVPGIVGMAAALAIRATEMEEEGVALSQLRDELRAGVEEIPGCRIHGPVSGRLPGNLNIGFDGVDAESLMVALRGFSLSSGSACSAGSRGPSHVLTAIGLSDDEAMSSIRIGLGKGNTREHVDLLVAELARAVDRIRSLSTS